MSKKLSRLMLSLVLVLAVAAVAGCGSGGSDGGTSDSGSATAAEGAETTEGTETTSSSSGGDEYKVVISNNFLGNDFRPQMLKLAELTAEEPPFKGKVDLEIVNSEPTTQAQSQSLNSIIASQPDAMLVDASSATALNPAIARACAAGIKVIAFDNGVTDSCAYNVLQDWRGGQNVVGQWMSEVLGGSGSVIVDSGLAGAASAKEIEEGFLEGLKVGGGVEVSGTYEGQYALGPAQQGISQLLVGHTVDGVMTQSYCTAAFNAAKSTGNSRVPTTCVGYNGELLACAEKESQCAVLSASPMVVQLAMKLALEVLEGGEVPATSEVVRVPMTLFVSPGTEFTPKENPANVKMEAIKVGKNAFTDLPPGLALPVSSPEYDITPEQFSK